MLSHYMNRKARKPPSADELGTYFTLYGTHASDAPCDSNVHASIGGYGDGNKDIVRSLVVFFQLRC